MMDRVVKAAAHLFFCKQFLLQPILHNKKQITFSKMTVALYPIAKASGYKATFGKTGKQPIKKIGEEESFPICKPDLKTELFSSFKNSNCQTDQEQNSSEKYPTGFLPRFSTAQPC